MPSVYEVLRCKHPQHRKTWRNNGESRQLNAEIRVDSTSTYHLRSDTAILSRRVESVQLLAIPLDPPTPRTRWFSQIIPLKSDTLPRGMGPDSGGRKLDSCVSGHHGERAVGTAPAGCHGEGAELRRKQGSRSRFAWKWGRRRLGGNNGRVEIDYYLAHFYRHRYSSMSGYNLAQGQGRLGARAAVRIRRKKSNVRAQESFDCTSRVMDLSRD